MSDQRFPVIKHPRYYNNIDIHENGNWATSQLLGELIKVSFISTNNIIMGHDVNKVVTVIHNSDSIFLANSLERVHHHTWKYKSQRCKLF